ncbi:glycosyltransferase [Psychromarinibacter sp. C21-152]|uniref:Glycosyltransferase n=1 Tax=Psychromarinibacter sediminicola TaxID=3033385 RepID=A0AAE3NX83_9RHOB|nr:glycosyltransferase [Psychromarinibacter sediminicola]MDF0603761.1 glycosyltransferase [Psychromarinibacter sediminicola]
MADPSARCLDLTRLVSRLGRGAWTGVDRVELAYLRHLVAAPGPLFGLVRTALGYLLLDGDGMARALARIDGQAAWGAPDLVGRLSRKAHPVKRRAEADLRRWAVARARRGALAGMLRKSLPAGTVYFNVGHSDLGEEVLAAWRAVPGARVAVLIHDAIPLEHPAYQRPGTVESFRGKLARVAAHADVVIHSCETTRAATEAWLAKAGRVPEALVAPLGVEVPVPGALPPGLPPEAPYFVTVGTIEPRKDHALLLDVWEALGAGAPRLVIAGRRGWANAAVFRRLDTSPMIGRTVFERGDLDDGAVAALLKGSAGLLFPSRAEGYGLPPLEALALDVPVVCADLPVYREILGDMPVYARVGCVYHWTETIVRITDGMRTGRGAAHVPPTVPGWADHFNRVLTVL